MPKTLNWTFKKFSHRIWLYLTLLTGLLIIPFFLGVAAVRLFNQAPGFALSGIFLGESAIHCAFAFMVLKRKAWKNIGLGLVLFAVTLGLALLIFSMESINDFTYRFLPGDSLESRVMRGITFRSLIALLVWELTSQIFLKSKHAS